MADILDKSVNAPVLGETPVIPVLLMVMGAYLTWFGVHYWASDTKWPTDPIKAVLTGKGIPVPDRSASQKALQAIAKSQQNTASANQNTGNASGAVNNPNVPAGPLVPGKAGSIVGDALRYQGDGYVWGGNADKPGNWDCSSFVSYVLGHDNQMTLPGGGKYGDPGYPPNAHGPTTNDYMLFGTPVIAAEVKPGDLAISSVHMGIIVDVNGYVSALNPHTGVAVQNWQIGFPGGPAVYRRVATS